MMETPNVEALKELKSRGLLCLAPPTDDDDAYILAIARRADSLWNQQQRSRSQQQESEIADDAISLGFINGRESATKTSSSPLLGGGFVVSGDLFRDAIDRDGGKTGLRKWLNGSGGRRGHYDGNGSRISFTFCPILGQSDSSAMEFVPNPRHHLIAELERRQLLSSGMP